MRWNLSSERRGIGSVLGSLESDVMEVLWAIGTGTVGDVEARLAGDSAYTTVKTVMERMTVKGLVERVKVGRAYEYRALVSREEMEARVSRGVIEGLLAGFGSTAVAQFADVVADDPEKLAELRALLAKMAGEEDAGR